MEKQRNTGLTCNRDLVRRSDETTGNILDYDDVVDDDVNLDDETHARGIGVERPWTTLRRIPKASGQQPLGGIRSTMPTTRNYTAEP